MAGAKPLDQNEINSILGNLKNARDKALFVLGVRTGFRISELLSITVQDAVQFGEIKPSVTVSRKNMKGKISSRTVVLHREAREALEAMGVLQMAASERLFPIGRMQATRILRSAVNKARLQGRITTHSMRKTFAQRAYEKLGKDLRKTQIATGHKSLNSLAHYLQYDEKEVEQAILGD